MAFSYFKSGTQTSALHRMLYQLSAGFARRFPNASRQVALAMFMKPPKAKRERQALPEPEERVTLRTSAGRTELFLFGAQGPVALLSHGWGDSAQGFSAMAEHLLTQGYRVAIPEHVGHGQSPERRSHLPAFVETLQLSLTELSRREMPPALIVGHSMGALAVLNLDDDHLRSTRICLISLPVRFFEIMFDRVERAGLSSLLLERALEHVMAPEGRRWSSYDTQAQRHKLTPETLFIHDEQDRYAPFPDVQALVESSGARLLKTQGLGHRRILSSPEVLDAVVSEPVTDFERCIPA